MGKLLKTTEHMLDVEAKQTGSKNVSTQPFKSLHFPSMNGPLVYVPPSISKWADKHRYF